MDASDLVLLIVANSEDASLRGRTLLQKTAYFINQIEDCGISYFAHYYGPYSREIADAVDSLVGVGFLRESPTHSLPQRFDYSLTDAGREIATYISDEEPESAKRINQIIKKINNRIGSDYQTLSIAAKAYHILEKEKRPMGSNDIAGVANSMGWSINPEQASRALNILSELELTE